MNKTCARLVQALYEANEPLSVIELASLLDLSTNTVRTYLKLIQASPDHNIKITPSTEKKRATTGRSVLCYSL